MHTYLIVYRLYMNYSGCEIILRMISFYTSQEQSEALTGYLSLVAGLSGTGQMCDIGQKGLQPSFQRGDISSLSYCHVFFLSAFLKEAFIRNIIIIQCINYTT